MKRNNRQIDTAARASGQSSANRQADLPNRQIPAMRPATPEDLASIEHWLKDEYDRAATGLGFWNNVNIIRNAAREGRLTVLQTQDSSSPVAFCVFGHGYASIDILEVHPAHRHQGHGRALARHCFNQARLAGAEDITVLCEPNTSVPFWKAIGFVDIDGGSADFIQLRMVLT